MWAPVIPAQNECERSLFRDKKDFICHVSFPFCRARSIQERNTFLWGVNPHSRGFAENKYQVFSILHNGRRRNRHPYKLINHWMVHKLNNRMEFKKRQFFHLIFFCSFIFFTFLIPSISSGKMENIVSIITGKKTCGMNFSFHRIGIFFGGFTTWRTLLYYYFPSTYLLFFRQRFFPLVFMSSPNLKGRGKLWPNYFPFPESLIFS